jgi:hypothetical protein
MLINNEYKKYDGIQAIQYNDENKYLSFIISEVQKNNYFLFGSDSCDVITKYYSECLKYSSNCILITADTKFILDDVNEQFKNKFVFYSPSITCGVDFNISEKQNVFLYIKGDTLEPCDSFQQLTRTRNIKNVYFYVKRNTSKLPKYATIKDCEEEFKSIAFTHSKLCNICCNVDNNDDVVFNDNTFFKLFVYNEYINDIYNTNKELHFKKILTDNGFILNKLYKSCQLSKVNKTLLIDNKNELKKKIFDDHVENIKTDEVLEMASNFLNLLDKEAKTKYYNVLMDKFLREDYLNVIRYFTKPEIIKEKVSKLNKRNVEYKTIYSNHNKIMLINDLENELKINKLDVTKLSIDKVYKISVVLHPSVQCCKIILYIYLLLQHWTLGC